MTLAVCASIILSGCATLYLHSPQEEKAASELKAGLDAAKTAHLAAIDRHRAWLDDAIAKERLLVARRELSRRDQLVTAILDGPNSPALLRDAIDRRFRELAAVPLARLDARKLANASSDLADARQDLGEALTRRDQQTRLAGFEAPYCNDRGQKLDKNIPADDELDYICGTTIPRYAGEVDDAYSRAGPVGAALLGDDRAAGSLGTRSDMRLAIVEAADLRTASAAQKALSAAAQKQLKALTALYACERKRDAAPGPSARIAAAAKEIADFSRFLAELDEAKLESAAAQPAAAPAAAAPDQCAQPGRIDTAGGLIAEARNSTPALTVADIRKALIGLRELKIASTLLAGIQEKAQTFRASKLAEALDGLADPTPGAQKTPAATIAAASARLLDNLDRLEAATSGELPDVSGVLVRIAAARMRADTARIEAERLNKLTDFAGLRVAALGVEALGLAAASLTLERGRANAFERSLLRYSNAWSLGRMPTAVMTADMKNAAYASWIQRERAVVDAAYGVLQPVTAELETYGAGGFTAADITRYLQVVGLGAIAGTN